DRPLLILSGVFGLLDAHTPTPWYDHALQGCDVHVLAPRVAGRLVSRRITTLELVMDHPDTPGWAPYHAVVVQAARHAGVRLRPRWSAQP
ncbi:MAG: hypothetical protein VX000_14795, partial [Myxococcota bacterium]|nr:hypothetical protein [Myxococcota bacterium]